MRGLLHTRLVHDQILQDDVLHGHLSVQPLAFLGKTRLPDCHSDPGTPYDTDAVIAFAVRSRVKAVIEVDRRTRHGRFDACRGSWPRLMMIT